MKKLLSALLLVALALCLLHRPAPVVSAAAPATQPDRRTYDWPMWGRSNDRMMISPEKNPPVDFDFESGKNMNWSAKVGSKSYGNPVISGGLVFIGTNNEAHYDPKFKADGGVIAAFRESDGKFLWQHFNEKLAAGRVNDWPQEGICSTVL